MFTFSKNFRLRDKKDFEYVFKEPNKTVNQELVLLHRKNSLGYPRLGIIISKKKVAKAFQRNRIKRVLRESFRLTTLPGIDLIILARQGLGTVDSKLINTNLGITWKKLVKFYPES